MQSFWFGDAVVVQWKTRLRFGLKEDDRSPPAVRAIRDNRLTLYSFKSRKRSTQSTIEKGVFPPLLSLRHTVKGANTLEESRAA